ncbi:MAG: hypothetical protein M3R36_17620 [Bacteroidota bacterium]|nr:hypothetical protein [Bacteroidota bacterium]
MKKIALFLFLTVFCYTASAQENYPKLKVLKNMASLNKINYDSPIDKNLEKFNSKSVLTDLSFKKNEENKSAAKPKSFNFSIAPYFWALAIGGTLSIPNEDQYFTFNKSFSDAVKNLKMAAMVYGKFKYKRVSFLYDIGYINLKRFGATVPQGLGLVSANVTAKQLLADLSISYLFPSKSKSTMVDIYVGTRMLDLDIEATVILDSVTTSRSRMSAYTNTWLSPLLGVNSEFYLSPKWLAYAKGDIGGFGVNEQMTWQLAAGAGYNFSPNFFTTFGFKYVGFNFYKTDYKWTVNDYGIVVALGYKY